MRAIVPKLLKINLRDSKKFQIVPVVPNSSAVPGRGVTFGRSGEGGFKRNSNYTITLYTLLLRNFLYMYRYIYICNTFIDNLGVLSVLMIVMLRTQ